MLRRTFRKIQKCAQSHPKAKAQAFCLIWKAVAFLKNIRARWKTHSSRDNDVCVIVIKQISAIVQTVQRQPVMTAAKHMFLQQFVFHLNSCTAGRGILGLLCGHLVNIPPINAFPQSSAADKFSEKKLFRTAHAPGGSVTSNWQNKRDPTS